MVALAIPVFLQASFLFRGRHAHGTGRGVEQLAAPRDARRLTEIPADDRRASDGIWTSVGAPPQALGAAPNRAIRALIAAVHRRGDALGVGAALSHIQRGAIGRRPDHRIAALGARTEMRVARAVVSHGPNDDLVRIDNGKGAVRRAAPLRREVHDRPARALNAPDDQRRIPRIRRGRGAAEPLLPRAYRVGSDGARVDALPARALRDRARAIDIALAAQERRRGGGAIALLARSKARIGVARGVVLFAAVLPRPLNDPAARNKSACRPRGDGRTSIAGADFIA